VRQVCTAQAVFAHRADWCALLFIGCYFSDGGKSDDEIADICYRFADSFTKEFGSLRCFDLRPNGFNKEDKPHLCEDITCRAIEFAYHFISGVA
jgi:hypothetical protein